MTWDEMAIDLLRAAKSLRQTHPRSTASRAYYAAHVAVAKALLANGYTPATGRTTQPHFSQGMLIDRHLAWLQPQKLRELRRLMARLYARRIDADYVPTARIDGALALDSIRNASSVFVILNMPEAV